MSQYAVESWLFGFVTPDWFLSVLMPTEKNRRNPIKESRRKEKEDFRNVFFAFLICDCEWKMDPHRVRVFLTLCNLMMWWEICQDYQDLLFNLTLNYSNLWLPGQTLQILFNTEKFSLLFLALIFFIDLFYFYYLIKWFQNHTLYDLN